MRLSVIVPVLNEESRLAGTIARARAAGADEVIVVDGGSSDTTWSIAQLADERLRSYPGRAFQQNAGAAVAKGDVLLFLHADCTLPADARRQIELALRDASVIGGGFVQRMDHSRWSYRWIERGNAWRARRWGWIYGDQGLFVRKEIFEQAGRFREVALLEDLFLSRTLLQMGRLVIVEGPLLVSARRWERAGWWRQTLLNWVITVLGLWGVSPERLARWYRVTRTSD